MDYSETARKPGAGYSKNVNARVAIALVGLGMHATRVCLVSARNVFDPLRPGEPRGAFGYFRVYIFARASANYPKTSALTAYSILQSARLGGVTDSRDLAVVDFKFPGAQVGRAAHAAACPGVK